MIRLGKPGGSGRACVIEKWVTYLRSGEERRQSVNRGPVTVPADTTVEDLQEIANQTLALPGVLAVSFRVFVSGAGRWYSLVVFR